MTVNNVHGLAPVKLHSESQSEVVLAGVLQNTIESQTEVLREATDGELYSRIANMTAQRPISSFRTRDVNDALATVAMGGYAISAGVNPGVVFYGQLQEEGGGRGTGAVHRSWTIREGIVVPMRLTVEHGGDAEIEYQAFATYDGTNNPVVIAESVTLPTVTTAGERFTLPESVQVAGNTLNGVRRLEIDFGFEVEQIDADGDRWPTLVRIKEVNPTVTLQGIESNWLSASNLSLQGDCCTHADTIIYLRKRDTCVASGFVANVTAEHVKLSVDGLAYSPQIHDASGNELAENSIQIDCKFDGTNTPLVPTVDSAIT